MSSCGSHLGGCDTRQDDKESILAKRTGCLQSFCPGRMGDVCRAKILPRLQPRQLASLLTASPVPCPLSPPMAVVVLTKTAECRGPGLGVRHFADSLETCSTGKVFYLERNSSRTHTHPSRPVFILSLLPTEEEQRSPA